MRIGIDARLLGSAPGIGRYIEHLLKRFFVIAPEHTYVIFLHKTMIDTFVVPENISVELIHAPERWYSWSEQVTWPYRIAKAKLDCIFVPQFNVPLITPCPFIVTIHDVTQLYVPGRLQRSSLLHRFAFRVAFSHAVKSAKTVIAVSEYTRKEIVRNFSISKDRIRVIYEGNGLSGLSSGESPEKDPYMLAVGVWRPHKNFIGLLEAFAFARQKNPEIADIKLVLVGEEDPRYPEVRASIARLKLGDSVVTPGKVSDEVLDAYYRGAQAVIVPSFFEGFGFIGLEALARGVPVASARVASLPEILGPAAIYFDPESKEDMVDGILKVLTDTRLREDILDEAPMVLERYSWDITARETIKVIEEAIS